MRRSQDICICPGSILGPAAGPQRGVSFHNIDSPRPASLLPPSTTAVLPPVGAGAARDTQEKNKALDTRVSEAGIHEDPWKRGCGQS